VPFGMLEGFAQSGVMPSTAKIIQGGAFRQMRSAIPEISSVAWSSIITGSNPGRHGIFGFTDLRPNSYKLKFPNFGDLKQPPFWQQCKGKSIIINVPSTYPVRDMNGVHISGFVSIDFEKSVHPKSLIPQLKEMDYRLDVDAQKAHNSMELFLEDLDKTLDARITAYRRLWEEQNWQNFMLVFTGTDRLMHFLWDAYEDENHKYHNYFLDHFRKIDKAIGEITDNISSDDILIILSDHGFGKLEKDVYVNCLLANEGFLSFRGNDERGLDNIDSGTKAFAMDPARIYVNLKDKYPSGSLEEKDKESVLKELEALFKSFEVDGKKVIKHIYRKEDVYDGPCVENGPDMVLIAEKGFNLKGAMASQRVADKGPFTGKHTYEDAMLLINNKQIASKLRDRLSVIDAGKLIQSLVT